MIEPPKDRPPQGSPIVVESLPDGVRLVLRGVRFSGVLGECSLLVILTALALALTIHMLIAVHQSTFALEHCLYFVILAGFVLYASALIATIIGKTRSATIEATGDRLIVAIWGSSRNSWRHEQIRAIAAWKGLQIGDTAGKVWTFLTERNLDELIWVAEVIRRYLRLPENLPARPGELAVRYTGNFWDKPISGLLRVQPGIMSLRHSFSLKPHLRFRTGGIYPNSFHDALTLGESNVTCRISEGDSACLQIAPDNVHCRIDDKGRPELKVSLLGPVLHVRIFLEAGTTGKRKLTAAEKEFWLNIQCEDGEGLQRALGRFWGDRAQA
jgi:hypothetical protein